MGGKIISIYNHSSLFELDWEPGEPILIYEHNPELSEIAILMRPYEIIPGNDKRIGFSVSFTYQNDAAEEYIFLTPKKTALGLWLPDDHSQTISTQRIHPEASPQPYTITQAMAGEEAITRGLYEIVQGREPRADTIRQKPAIESIDVLLAEFLNESEMGA